MATPASSAPSSPRPNTSGSASDAGSGVDSGQDSHGGSSGSTTPSSDAAPTSALRKRFMRHMKATSSDGTGSTSVQLQVPNDHDGEVRFIAPGTPLHEIRVPKKSFFQAMGGGRPAKEEQTWTEWFLGRKLFFPIGVVIGAMLCMLLMRDMTEIQGDLADIWSTIPSSLDPRDLLNNVTLLDGAKKALDSRDFLTGEDAKQRYGLKKKHPIVLIPGIISTGLESWSTEPVARTFFRKRLWGTSTMIRAVMTNKETWLEALSIDAATGLDPVGHKVRAAQGLDAASEFIQGYWVWQKIVQNLAVLGYDTNSMDMAAYDWRLAYSNLEVRDAYFTRLKHKIELFRRTNGEKVVLCSHSMGGTVILYFLKWVEADPSETGHGGGGGPGWVDEHIASWINIAGSILGVAKAMTAFLSGEMRDTVELHPAGSWVLEKFFSRRERAKLFRLWPGASSMWMKGGNRIWGDLESAPAKEIRTHDQDDPHNATDTYGRFFSFRHPGTPLNDESLTKHTVSPNLTVDDASPYVLTHTPSHFQRMIGTNYSYGFETDEGQLEKNDADHTKWTNPLEVRLPDAPDMKVFCLYGHGKETEGEFDHDESRSEAETIGEAICDPSDDSVSNSSCTTERTPLDFPLARRHRIDSEVTVKGSIPEVRSGVKFGDGDGTIPVLSLGAMCVKGWKGKTRWNPSGMEVVTQEYLHSPEGFELRGGPQTADHVDILGSTPLNAAILKIAAGRYDLVPQKIGSRILEYVEKMRWD